MKNLMFLTLLLIPMCSWSQQVTLDEKLEILNSFLEDRIPSMHSGIDSYSLTIKNSSIVKTNLTSDGDSNSEAFDLTESSIYYEYYELMGYEKDLFEMDGFWEVFINHRTFHTELSREHDAELIVKMIKAIQKSIAEE